jgi:hypothetical protein
MSEKLSKLLRADFILVFFIILFCIFFTYFFFGFYYSEYEGLNTALLSSSLTPGIHFRSVYFSGNMGISYFYSLFYQFQSGVQWISWLEYLWLFIAVSISMFVLWANIPERFTKGIKIVFIIVMFFLVFADHHIHLIYTRVSYMICGASLIGLVAFFEDSARIQKKWWLFIFLNLFFAIGTLIRNEASLACFLLLVPYALISLKSFRQVFILFCFPLLVLTGQSMFFAIDIKNASNNEFYKQVEPDIEEQYTARGNLLPLSMMKAHRDSVVYALAAEMSFSDPRIITPAYLRSLVRPEGFLFTDGHQWRRVVFEQKNILLKYWYLVFIVFLLSGGLYIQLKEAGGKYSFYYWLVFVLSFWGLSIVQTYVDKVNERSWLPYISLFIFCHIILWARGMKNAISKRELLILMSCAILFLVHIFELKKESNNLKNDLLLQQKQFDTIKALAANKVLVINSSAFSCLFASHTPFQLFDYSAFKKVYIIDSYILPFLPYYRQYLNHECNCEIYEFPSFWNYIKTGQQDVVIISRPSRMTAIHEYLKEIHGVDLPLVSLAVDTTREDWRAWKISQ